MKEDDDMTTAEKRYADIIHLPRPEFEDVMVKYPRQPLSERAKIFSPFAALRGHEEKLSEEDDKLMLETRKELSEEDQTHVNSVIVQLRKGMAAAFTVFRTEDEEQKLGRYMTLNGTVIEVEPVFGTVRLNVRDEGAAVHEEKILFNDICRIDIVK